MTSEQVLLGYLLSFVCFVFFLPDVLVPPIVKISVGIGMAYGCIATGGIYINFDAEAKT